MICPEWISAGSDAITALAAIAASGAAAFGITSWRRELTGRAEFDAARGLIRATYKLRNAIADCRSPFVSSHEFPLDYRGFLSRHSAEEEAAAWGQVYRGRWAPIQEALQEFDAQALEAESIWGEDVRLRTDDARKCVQFLFVAIESFIADKVSEGANFGANPDFGVSVRRDLNASRTDTENPLSAMISSAIDGIEGLVRPHLRRA